MVLPTKLEKKKLMPGAVFHRIFLSEVVFVNKLGLSLQVVNRFLALPAIIQVTEIMVPLRNGLG